MQPYFFPYIGYFQLIADVDSFIVHDDVQYIKAGWINRNLIRAANGPRWLTLPVLSAGHERTIHQRSYQLTANKVARTLRCIEASYKSAPRFTEIFPLLREIMSFGDPNVAAFNFNLINRLATYLGIGTRLLRSSEIVIDNRLNGEARVIDLCLRVGATEYVNPVGGLNLYRPESFAAAGIALWFLEPHVHSYQQFGANPVASLSIIDVLMFNSNPTIATMLKEYRLSTAGAEHKSQ